MNLDRWLYQAGLQCTKRMHRMARGVPGTGAALALALSYATEARQAARALFPEAATTPETLTWEDATAWTRERLTPDGPRALLDAALEFADVRVRADVLERSRRMKWRVSAIRLGGALADRHLDDLALQVWVARNAGLDVREVQLITLNRAYVREEDLDPAALFVFRDVTHAMEQRVEQVHDRTARLLPVIMQPEEPVVEVGDHCSTPFECQYFDRCWPVLPRDDIRRLPGLHANRKRELLAAGIARISEIPDSVPLTDRQKLARRAHAENRLVWSQGLDAELNKFRYPVTGIDFECVAPAVPRYRGMRPWQQIPFQWSAHWMATPGGRFEHASFLADGSSDPRRGFAESLLAALPAEGTVLVWSKPFEDHRLRELEELLPDLASPLRALRRRLVDLLEIVRKHVYHPDFLGSFSLKSVLPVLVPELSYSDLTVGRGDEAAMAWERIRRDSLSPTERNALRSALEEYCRLDTLAMVRILVALRSRVLLQRAP
jgi:predicted RecB family nuclease